MRTPQKAIVIGLFLLGGFTTITGIIRLHFLTYAYASLKHPLYNDVTCKWLSRVSFSLLIRVMRRQLRTSILLVDHRDKCWHSECLPASTATDLHSLSSHVSVLKTHQILNKQLQVYFTFTQNRYSPEFASQFDGERPCRL